MTKSRGDFIESLASLSRIWPYVVERVSGRCVPMNSRFLLSVLGGRSVICWPFKLQVKEGASVFALKRTAASLNHSGVRPLFVCSERLRVVLHGNIRVPSRLTILFMKNQPLRRAL